MLKLNCMKKILVLGCLLMSVVGLFGQNKASQEVEGYVINGVVEGKYKADKVYLLEQKEIQGETTVIDSANVVDNRYTFKGGNVKYPRMCFIKSAVPECTSPLLPFFLENGTIRIRGNADFFMNSEARGTINNDIFSFYNFLKRYVNDSLMRAFIIDSQIHGVQDEKTELEELRRRSDLMKRREREIETNVFEQYPDQVCAPYIVYLNMKHDLSLDELKALRAKIDPNLNEHPYTKQWDEFIRLKDFKVGSMMPDFSLPDQNGKMIRLADYRGKYVFIDFWASWCGPCMKEMPNVVKLYKACKGKNFEILGISLDNKKDAWTAAIKKNGMKWPQLCDFLAWATAPAKACGVQAIPQTILIDPQGEVIALGLRGVELEKKIKEVLNKK